MHETKGAYNMSHFYGGVKGNRGRATRGGSKNSGYESYCTGWGGGIEVWLKHDPKTEKDYYVVSQVAHCGKGIEREIARGILGERDIITCENEVYDKDIGQW
jgi:hypothetical protein